MTHTAKCSESAKKPDRKFRLPVWLFCTLRGVGSHDLGHKIPHGFRSLILHLPGGVGVGAEGEARIVVSQHTADRFHIYAVLERQGCESVPLWHNKDKSENPCVARVKGDRELFPQRAA